MPPQMYARCTRTILRPSVARTLLSPNVFCTRWQDGNASHATPLLVESAISLGAAHLVHRGAPVTERPPLDADDLKKNAQPPHQSTRKPPQVCAVLRPGRFFHAT